MIVVFTLRTSVPRIKPDEDVRKQIGDQVQAFSGEAAQALGPEALMKLHSSDFPQDSSQYACLLWEAFQSLCGVSKPGTEEKGKSL